MCNLRIAILLASMSCGVASSAFAGAGTLSATMTRLADNVTYSIASPAMPTYVGFTIGLSNSGGNTINNISFTVKARATDTAETVALFSGLPAGCNPNPSDASEFTCTVGQLQAGQSIASFTVFYKAPVKVLNNQYDDPGTDFVDLHLQVVYAERFGGVPSSPPQNSVADFDTATANSVEIGTNNPTRVKSGVPKNQTVSLYTGTAGIPTSTNKSTMLASIPALGAVTTADLSIDPASDPSGCLTQGHFTQCPTYSVTIPGTLLPYLTTTYRIDASNLQMAPNKILNGTLILYTGGTFVDTPVGACTNGQPNTGSLEGLPCVLSKQCYKNNAQPADLAGDCEWILINTKNGLTKFF